MSWLQNLMEKFNRAQPVIARDEGTNINTDAKVSYLSAFNRLESVNRGVNMVVSAVSGLDFDIKEKVAEGVMPGIRAKQLHSLLNIRPNPYQDIHTFRNAMYTDFLLEGNVFLYYDGAFLYHLPAANVVVEPHPKVFVGSYTYNNEVKYAPNEIIHFRDVGVASIYRGTSRLSAADRNIRILYNMLEFQEQFFKNGAVPGFALSTENTLSPLAKERTLRQWMTTYSPTNGAKRPIIIDSGLKPVQLFTTNFKEMDFDVSVKTNNVKILETIGVPPVLLDGGNQANISPNLRLFYLETVLPIARKFVSAMEHYTGYDLDAITSNVSALQPELKDLGAYYVGLVNGGLITPNEAREELRYEKDKDPESDKLRVPANIAGSAVQPNIGGAPKKPAKTGEEK